MQNFLDTSTDSKEHSVEVKRETKSFLVPQQKQPTTSSVDDSIDNTPIYIGEQKQEKIDLLTNHLKEEEKMEENTKTNSLNAIAYENEIKNEQVTAIAEESSIETKQEAMKVRAEWERPTRKSVIETALQESEKDFEVFSDPIEEFMKITNKKVYLTDKVIEKGITPIDYLIKNLIVKSLSNEGDKKIHIIHGQPSSYKSTLLSQMAIHLASNTDFLYNKEFLINNRDAKGNIQPIIWVALEEPISKVAKRFEDQIDKFIEMGYIKAEDKKEVLHRILIVDDEMLDEVILDDGKVLLQDLQSLVLTTKPSAIFYDTFTAICGRKGVDVSNMTGMGRILTPYQDIANLGVVSFFSCHNTKQEYDREMSSAQGNNSLQASAKLMISMRNDKEKGKGYHIMAITKSNDFEKQKFSLKLEYPVFICEGSTEGELPSVDKKKQEFIETLKYADRLLKEFDNDLNKVVGQLNTEGKKTLRGCPWQRDNLRKELKKLYEGKFGPYYR